MNHRFPTSAILLLLGWAAVTMDASAEIPTTPIWLWPDRTPENDSVKTERVIPDKGDHVTRLTDVTAPSMTLYPAKSGSKPAPAALVCPGGGYGILAINHEGTEIVEWLNRLGITAALLKYSVPKQRDKAFQDVQRAMGLLRHHAGDWGIQTNHIGIIGFSAGGHLSARLSNNFTERSYPTVDGRDGTSCRPDFALLIYPAYLVKKNTTDLYPEVQVSAATPPTILIQTQDDNIRVENSLFYYAALKKAGVPSELHLYPSGGHGYGLRRRTHAVSNWPKLCEIWMRGLGVLGPAPEKQEIP